MIDRTLGTPIGNMTANGGLAAAFDGNIDQTHAASAVDAVTEITYIGKDWGAGVTKIVSGFKAYGSNNWGFHYAVDPDNVVITLQGSTDNFVSSIVDLGSSSVFTDANSLLISKLTGIIVTTAYRYHRLKITPVPYINIACAEAQFYETVEEETGKFFQLF
jgi:hypothetical protein